MSTIYSDLPEILVRLDGNVGVVCLHRPEFMNAFTEEMKSSLIEAFRRLDLDNNVKVVVLTSTPNSRKIFCAGADLSKGDFSSSNRYTTNQSGVEQAHHNSARNMNEHRDGGGQTSLAAFSIRKPTICAINGSAVGIGITMTLGFDIRIAYKDAKIGFVFARRGIVPEAASSFFLPKLVGHSKALELCMTGRIQPASSKSLELLFSSCEQTPESTVSVALAMAHEIADQNSMISMALTKALIWRGENSAEEQHLLDSKAMHIAGNSVDSKEGVLAFKEKRAPNYVATIPRDLPTELYPWWAPKRVARL